MHLQCIAAVLFLIFQVIHGEERDLKRDNWMLKSLNEKTQKKHLNYRHPISSENAKRSDESYESQTEYVKNEAPLPLSYRRNIAGRAGGIEINRVRRSRGHRTHKSYFGERPYIFNRDNENEHRSIEGLGDKTLGTTRKRQSIWQVYPIDKDVVDDSKKMESKGNQKKYRSEEKTDEISKYLRERKRKAVKISHDLTEEDSNETGDNTNETEEDTNETDEDTNGTDEENSEDRTKENSEDTLEEDTNEIEDTLWGSKGKDKLTFHAKHNENYEKIKVRRPREKEYKKSCPTDGYFPDLKSCRKFYHCIKRKIIYFKCRNKFFIYSPTEKNCIPYFREKCVNFNCKKNKNRNVPYERDSQIYATCDKNNAKIIHKCPKDYEYIEWYQKCEKIVKASTLPVYSTTTESLLLFLSKTTPYKFSKPSTKIPASIDQFKYSTIHENVTRKSPSLSLPNYTHQLINESLITEAMKDYSSTHFPHFPYNLNEENQGADSLYDSLHDEKKTFENSDHHPYEEPIPLNEGIFNNPFGNAEGNSNIDVAIPYNRITNLPAETTEKNINQDLFIPETLLTTRANYLFPGSETRTTFNNLASETKPDTLDKSPTSIMNNNTAKELEDISRNDNHDLNMSSQRYTTETPSVLNGSSTVLSKANSKGSESKTSFVLETSNVPSFVSSQTPENVSSVSPSTKLDNIQPLLTKIPSAVSVTNKPSNDRTSDTLPNHSINTGSSLHLNSTIPLHVSSTVIGLANATTEQPPQTESVFAVNSSFSPLQANQTRSKNPSSVTSVTPSTKNTSSNSSQIKATIGSHGTNQLFSNYSSSAVPNHTIKPITISNFSNKPVFGNNHSTPGLLNVYEIPINTTQSLNRNLSEVNTIERKDNITLQNLTNLPQILNAPAISSTMPSVDLISNRNSETTNLREKNLNGSVATSISVPSQSFSSHDGTKSHSISDKTDAANKTYTNNSSISLTTQPIKVIHISANLSGNNPLSSDTAGLSYEHQSQTRNSTVSALNSTTILQDQSKASSSPKKISSNHISETNVSVTTPSILEHDMTTYLSAKEIGSKIAENPTPQTTPALTYNTKNVMNETKISNLQSNLSDTSSSSVKTNISSSEKKFSTLQTVPYTPLYSIDNSSASYVKNNNVSSTTSLPNLKSNSTGKTQERLAGTNITPSLNIKSSGTTLQELTPKSTSAPEHNTSYLHIKASFANHSTSELPEESTVNPVASTVIDMSQPLEVFNKTEKNHESKNLNNTKITAEQSHLLTTHYPKDEHIPIRLLNKTNESSKIPSSANGTLANTQNSTLIPNMVHANDIAGPSEVSNNFETTDVLNATLPRLPENQGNNSIPQNDNIKKSNSSEGIYTSTQFIINNSSIASISSHRSNSPGQHLSLPATVPSFQTHNPATKVIYSNLTNANPITLSPNTTYPAHYFIKNSTGPSPVNLTNSSTPEPLTHSNNATGTEYSKQHTEDYLQVTPMTAVSKLQSSFTARPHSSVTSNFSKSYNSKEISHNSSILNIEKVTVNSTSSKYFEASTISLIENPTTISPKQSSIATNSYKQDLQTISAVQKNKTLESDFSHNSTTNMNSTTVSVQKEINLPPLIPTKILVNSSSVTKPLSYSDANTITDDTKSTSSHSSTRTTRDTAKLSPPKGNYIEHLTTSPTHFQRIQNDTNIQTATPKSFSENSSIPSHLQHQESTSFSTIDSITSQAAIAHLFSTESSIVIPNNITSYEVAHVKITNRTEELTSNQFTNSSTLLSGSSMKNLETTSPSQNFSHSFQQNISKFPTTSEHQNSGKHDITPATANNFNSVALNNSSDLPENNFTSAALNNSSGPTTQTLTRNNVTTSKYSIINSTETSESYTVSKKGEILVSDLPNLQHYESTIPPTVEKLDGITPQDISTYALVPKNITSHVKLDSNTTSLEQVIRNASNTESSKWYSMGSTTPVGYQSVINDENHSNIKFKTSLSTPSLTNYSEDKMTKTDYRSSTPSPSNYIYNNISGNPSINSSEMGTLNHSTVHEHISSVTSAVTKLDNNVMNTTNATIFLNELINSYHQGLHKTTAILNTKIPTSDSILNYTESIPITDSPQSLSNSSGTNSMNSSPFENYLGSLSTSSLFTKIFSGITPTTELDSQLSNVTNSSTITQEESKYTTPHSASVVSSTSLPQTFPIIQNNITTLVHPNASFVSKERDFDVLPNSEKKNSLFQSTTLTTNSTQQNAIDHKEDSRFTLHTTINSVNNTNSDTHHLLQSNIYTTLSADEFKNSSGYEVRLNPTNNNTVASLSTTSSPNLQNQTLKNSSFSNHSLMPITKTSEATPTSISKSTLNQESKVSSIMQSTENEENLLIGRGSNDSSSIEGSASTILFNNLTNNLTAIESSTTPMFETKPSNSTSTEIISLLNTKGNASTTGYHLSSNFPIYTNESHPSRIERSDSTTEGIGSIILESQSTHITQASKMNQSYSSSNSSSGDISKASTTPLAAISENVIINSTLEKPTIGSAESNPSSVSLLNSTWSSNVDLSSLKNSTMPNESVIGTSTTLPSGQSVVNQQNSVTTVTSIESVIQNRSEYISPPYNTIKTSTNATQKPSTNTVAFADNSDIFNSSQNTSNSTTKASSPEPIFSSQIASNVSNLNMGTTTYVHSNNTVNSTYLSNKFSTTDPDTVIALNYDSNNSSTNSNVLSTTQSTNNIQISSETFSKNSSGNFSQTERDHETSSDSLNAPSTPLMSDNIGKGSSSRTTRDTSRYSQSNSYNDGKSVFGLSTLPIATQSVLPSHSEPISPPNVEIMVTTEPDSVVEPLVITTVKTTTVDTADQLLNVFVNSLNVFLG